MIKRDVVLTVAIGRNKANGLPWGDMVWREFRDEVRSLVESHATVVFAGNSEYAIGSDGTNEAVREDSFAIIAINPIDVEGLRKSFEDTLYVHQQASGAFAIDGAHDPVWTCSFAPKYDNQDNRRALVTAAEYKPAHGGYCE